MHENSGRLMPDFLQLVVFQLDDRNFAVHLDAVERVVRAVAPTVLPKAPDSVLGVINLQGRIIPVIDMRCLLNLPLREIRLSDQLLIVRTKRWLLALLVDSVIENIAREAAESTGPEKIFYGIKYVRGVVKFKDGLILIHDLDEFVADYEAANLVQLIKRQKQKPAPAKTSRTKKKAKPKSG